MPTPANSSSNLEIVTPKDCQTLCDLPFRGDPLDDPNHGAPLPGDLQVLNHADPLPEDYSIASIVHMRTRNT